MLLQIYEWCLFFEKHQSIMIQNMLVLRIIYLNDNALVTLQSSAHFNTTWKEVRFRVSVQYPLLCIAKSWQPQVLHTSKSKWSTTSGKHTESITLINNIAIKFHEWMNPQVGSRCLRMCDPTGTAIEQITMEDATCMYNWNVIMYCHHSGIREMWLQQIYRLYEI